MDAVKLFRLPQDVRFEGDRVRVRRIDQGVLLEPLISNAAEWFDELDRFNLKPFMVKRRNQPITPRREIFNYLLDTNACMALINGKPPTVRAKFQKATYTGAEVFVSSSFGGNQTSDDR